MICSFRHTVFLFFFFMLIAMAPSYAVDERTGNGAGGCAISDGNDDFSVPSTGGCGDDGAGGSYHAPAQGWVSDGFGARAQRVGGGSTHHCGVDIAGSVGDPVYAASDGCVTRANPADRINPNTGRPSGYGNYMVVDHGNGVVAQYSHLQHMNGGIGQCFRRGDIIGTMGSTGASTGPHLDFSLIGPSGSAGSYNDCPNPQAVFSCLSRPEMIGQISAEQRMCTNGNVDIVEEACVGENASQEYCNRDPSESVDCEANPDDPSCTSGVNCEENPKGEGCDTSCEAIPDGPGCVAECVADENGNFPASCEGREACVTDPETGEKTCAEVACRTGTDGTGDDGSTDATITCGLADQYTPIGASLAQTMNFDECLDFNVKLCQITATCEWPFPPFVTVGPTPGLKFTYKEPTAIVEAVCRPGKSYFMGDAPLAGLLGGSLDNEASEIHQCVTNRTQTSTQARRNAQFFETHIWGISPLARYASSGSPLDVTKSLTCGYIGKAMAMASGSGDFFKNMNLQNFNPGEALQNMGQNMGQAVQNFGQSIAQLPQQAMASLQGIGTSMGEMMSGAGDFVGNAVDSIQNFPAQVGEFMNNLPTNASEGFNGFMDSFSGGFSDVGNMFEQAGNMVSQLGRACSLTNNEEVCGAANAGSMATSVGSMMQGVEWSNMSPDGFRSTLSNLQNLDMEAWSQTITTVGTFAAAAEGAGIDLGGAGAQLLTVGAGMGLISNVDWNNMLGAAEQGSHAPGADEYFTGDAEGNVSEEMVAGLSTSGEEVGVANAVDAANNRNNNLYSIGSAALRVGSVAAGYIDSNRSTTTGQAAQMSQQRSDPAWLCDAQQSLVQSESRVVNAEENIQNGAYDEVIPNGSYAGPQSRSSSSCLREGAVGVVITVDEESQGTLKGYKEEIVGCTEVCNSGSCEWVPNAAGVNPADCTKPVSTFVLGAPAINAQSSRIEKIAYAVHKTNSINSNQSLTSAEKLNESNAVLQEAGITSEEMAAFSNHPEVQNPYALNVDGVMPACAADRAVANQQISTNLRATAAQTTQSVQMARSAVDDRIATVQQQYGCTGNNCGCQNGRPTGTWANSNNRPTGSSGGNSTSGLLMAGAGVVQSVGEQGGIGNAVNNVGGQIGGVVNNIGGALGGGTDPQDVAMDESGAFGGINTGTAGGDVNTGGTNPFNPNPIDGQPVNENPAISGNPSDPRNVSHGGVAFNSQAVTMTDNGDGTHTIGTDGGNTYTVDNTNGTLKDAGGNVVATQGTDGVWRDESGQPLESGGEDPGGTFETLQAGLATLDAITRDGGVKNAIAGLVGSKLPWGLWVAYFSEIDKESWYKADEGLMSVVNEMIGEFKVTVGATVASTLEIGEVVGVDSSVLQQRLYGLLGLVGSWGTLEPKTGWCFGYNPYVCSALAGYRGHQIAAALGSLPTDKSGKGMQMFNMDFPPKDGVINGSYKPTGCFEAGDIDFNAVGGGSLQSMVDNAINGGIEAFGGGSPETTLNKDEGYIYTYWKRTSCCILPPNCTPMIKQYY